MSELTVPGDADDDRARELVRDFVDEGDEIKVYRDLRGPEQDNEVIGTVVALEDDWFELDDVSGTDDTERIPYRSFDRLTRVQEG